MNSSRAAQQLADNINKEALVKSILTPKKGGSLIIGATSNCFKGSLTICNQIYSTDYIALWQNEIFPLKSR
ncbi:hypothetical protein RLOatenuis_8650 [Rickettsiales bacterium]|nr:hypothetical protein RLOatenuis_8650 [Rickettsiales bacterium]